MHIGIQSHKRARTDALYSHLGVFWWRKNIWFNKNYCSSRNALHISRMNALCHSIWFESNACSARIFISKSISTNFTSFASKTIKFHATLSFDRLGFLACFVVCLFVFWFCSAEAVRWYFRCFQFFNSTNWLRFAESQHILIGYLIQNRWRNIMSTHYGHWLSSLMPLVLPHQFSHYYCCICQLNTSNNKSEIETIWNIQKYSTWCQYNRLFG